MKVIRNQSPGIATGIGLKNDFAQTFQKIIAIEIIFKDLSAFNPSGNDMMQCTGGLPAIASSGEAPPSRDRLGGRLLSLFLAYPVLSINPIKLKLKN